jgi:hypothetical protein
MFRPIVVNSPQQQKNKMFEIARSIICGGQQQSFFMYEPDILKNAIKTWNLKLPKVTPYYAIFVVILLFSYTHYMIFDKLL